MHAQVKMVAEVIVLRNYMPKRNPFAAIRAVGQALCRTENFRERIINAFLHTAHYQKHFKRISLVLRRVSIIHIPAELIQPALYAT